MDGWAVHRHVGWGGHRRYAFNDGTLTVPVCLLPTSSSLSSSSGPTVTVTTRRKWTHRSLPPHTDCPQPIISRSTKTAGLRTQIIAHSRCLGSWVHPKRAKTPEKMASYPAQSHPFHRGQQPQGHPTHTHTSVRVCSPSAYSQVAAFLLHPACKYQT